MTTFVLHAPDSAAPTGAVVETAWRRVAGRHAYIVPSFVLSMLVCTWFVTWGDWALFQKESFTSFYDAQARAILHGRLDVPPAAIGFEAFIRDGKTYGYFGIAPALLRLPLVALFPAMDGCWSRSLMLIAVGINLLSAYRLVLLIRGKDCALSNADRFIFSLFILCAGIGSTNVFMVNRSYTYHEAIMWGSAFALLFAQALVAYFKKPTLSMLSMAGLFAFMSFHSRVTAGAGALLALGVTAVLPFVSAIVGWVYSPTVSAATHCKWWASTPTLQIRSDPFVGSAVRNVCCDRSEDVPQSGTYDSGDFVGSAPRTISARVKESVREAGPTRIADRSIAAGLNARPLTPAPCYRGESVRKIAKWHALWAGVMALLIVGVYLGVNYGKFRTLDGVPVQYYQLYLQNPGRMQVTGGRQIHPENIPTTLASYFGARGIRFDRSFPWVYLSQKPSWVGRPAIDVVEQYSSIPLSMPALFVLALMGCAPIVGGRNETLRHLRLPALGLLLGGCVILMTVGITQRYLHDFYPFLIVAGAAGACRLAGVRDFPGHARVMVGQTFLSAIESVSGGTFLSLPNRLESARQDKNVPHSRIRTDKNVCPTQFKPSPELCSPGNSYTPALASGNHVRAKAALLAVLALVSIALNCAFSLEYQRMANWGVPPGKRAQFTHMQESVDRLFHRQPRSAMAGE